MPAQIDIFQIHKDSLVQSCFTKRINVHHTLLQVLSIIGNYFESIPPLPPGGPLGVRVMCCSLRWDAVGWWGPSLVSSSRRLITSDTGPYTFSSGTSICLFPGVCFQSLGSQLPFPCLAHSPSFEMADQMKRDYL